MRWMLTAWMIGCVNIEPGKGPDTGSVRSSPDTDTTPFINDCSEGDNDQASEATPINSTHTAIDLCEQDVDVYEVSIRPGTWLSLTMEIDGSGHSGTDNSDLDLWELNRPDAKIDPALDLYDADLNGLDIVWSSAAHTRLERMAWFNPSDDIERRVVMVNGFDGATSQYNLSITESPWLPDESCMQGCNDLMLFPQAFDTTNGYVVTQWTQYSHIRRAVAYSIQRATAAVRDQYASVSPIGLRDMSQYDAETPGLLEGTLRHEEGSHRHGNHINVAYYQTASNNRGSEVCENDGFFCTATPHRLNAETTATFVDALVDDPLVVTIAMDPMIREAVLDAATAMGLGSRLNDVLVAGEQWPRRYIDMHIEYAFEQSIPIEP